MILRTPQLAHRVDGYRVYLPRACVAPNLPAYRRAVQAAYGSLRGVEFFKLDAGTRLEVAKDYYTLDVAQPTVHPDTSNVAG